MSAGSNDSTSVYASIERSMSPKRRSAAIGGSSENRPKDDLDVRGTFGPWNAASPSQTPLGAALYFTALWALGGIDRTMLESLRA